MPPLPAPPATYAHASPLSTLAPHLLPHLPTSLPLLGRLRHHTSTASSTKSVYATFAPGSSPPDSAVEPWSAVFVDRARHPETEAWIWTSYESEIWGQEEEKRRKQWQDQRQGTEDNDGRDEEDNAVAAKEKEKLLQMQTRAHLLCLLQDASTTYTQMTSLPSATTITPALSNAPATAAADKPVMILGSLNTVLMPLLAGREFHRLHETTVLSRDPLPPTLQREDREALCSGGAASSATGTTHEDMPDAVRERLLEERRQQQQQGNENEDGDKGVMGPRGVAGQENVLTGTSTIYVKWLLPLPLPSPPAPPTAASSQEQVPQGQHRSTPHPSDENLNFGETLPPEYYFDPSAPRTEELPLVVSRTNIPRSVDTLKELGRAGIRYRPQTRESSTTTAKGAEAAQDQQRRRTFGQEPRGGGFLENETAQDHNEETEDEGDLISWAFLGLDSSLSSLHVEPAHRNLGLAKLLTRYLLDLFLANPTGMGFDPNITPGTTNDNNNINSPQQAQSALSPGTMIADISIDNPASAGVIRSLGGRPAWQVRWVGIDVGRVEEAVGLLRWGGSIGLAGE